MKYSWGNCIPSGFSTIRCSKGDIVVENRRSTFGRGDSAEDSGVDQSYHGSKQADNTGSKHCIRHEYATCQPGASSRRIVTQTQLCNLYQSISTADSPSYHSKACGTFYWAFHRQEHVATVCGGEEEVGDVRSPPPFPNIQLFYWIFLYLNTIAMTPLPTTH